MRAKPGFAELLIAPTVSPTWIKLNCFTKYQFGFLLFNSLLILLNSLELMNKIGESANAIIIELEYEKPSFIICKIYRMISTISTPANLHY